MRQTMRSLVIPPDGGERLAIGPGEVIVRLAGDDTDGAMSLIEYGVAAGFPGPPLHVHPAFDEVFIVLDGALELRLGDEAVSAPAGTISYVRGDEPHTFANPSDAAARMLVLLAPAGFEAFFQDVAEIADGALPDPATMARLNAEHGVVAVP
jgi:mannose-6-phosphate isomerase-like protein (cupin superfamily)